MVSQQGAFYWRPNYELEMHHCAEALEFRNEYEGELPAIGSPGPKDAPDEERGALAYALEKGSLRCMVSAALDEPIASDDMFLRMQAPNWHHHFNEASSVTRERSLQLAPEGLPIWED
jgi:hypothetical protein